MKKKSLIAELAEMVIATVRLEGGLRRDPSKPDGTPRKLMSGARLAPLGWVARTPLDQGIHEVYH
ncbi:MAG: hypothetical protein V2I82_14640 [Halieaceae bacterium]|jgi:GDP-L-fucose synthase|nr:hypothetical protein [Halieaceae bacterium]